MAAENVRSKFEAMPFLLESRDILGTNGVAHTALRWSFQADAALEVSGVLSIYQLGVAQLAFTVEAAGQAEQESEHAQDDGNDDLMHQLVPLNEWHGEAALVVQQIGFIAHLSRRGVGLVVAVRLAHVSLTTTADRVVDFADADDAAV